MTSLEQIRDDLAYKHFGRSAILAYAGNQCIKCGKSATEFRDNKSKREYEIISYCQKCQDILHKENLWTQKQN